MNKKRKKQLEEITLKLSNISSELSTLVFDEDFSRDSIPENLTGTEWYERSEESSEAMESAGESIQDAINSLNEVLN